jgi:hypothetical protein
MAEAVRVATEVDEPVTAAPWTRADEDAMIENCLGLLAGVGYAALSPPPLGSTALVVLPSSVHDIPVQVSVATSDPVLARAVRTIHSGESPQASAQLSGSRA